MPPAKGNTRAKAQSDRPNTRADTRDSSTPETQHDINDAIEGRAFLEKHLLLCPPGEPPSHTSLATCLHQVSVMSGVAKPVMNAIRAIAFLLGEMEETQINDILREAFNNQITELTSDMASLIEGAKEKLDEQFKETEERLTLLVDKAITQPTTKQTQTFQPNSYATIVNNPPPHVNPRVAAKEGIKSRQFLLEGLIDTKFSHTDVFQLKTEFNKILEELGSQTEKYGRLTKFVTEELS